MQINSAQVAAVGRHVVSYAAGGITVAAGAVGILYSVHGITADQASALTDAFKQLGVGVNTIAGACATIASVGMALWAAYTASTKSQVQSVASVPGTVVVTRPEIAAALPQPNVVSNTEVKVSPEAAPSLGTIEVPKTGA